MRRTALVVGAGSGGLSAGIARRRAEWALASSSKAAAIGVSYVGIGLFGLVCRSDGPSMAFFVVLGALLLISGPLAAPRAAATGS